MHTTPLLCRQSIRESNPVSCHIIERKCMHTTYLHCRVSNPVSCHIIKRKCMRTFPLHCRQSIRVSNPSKLPAKFEVVPQEEGSMGLATYVVEPASGGVPALGEQVGRHACSRTHYVHVHATYTCVYVCVCVCVCVYVCVCTCVCVCVCVCVLCVCVVCVCV